MFVHHFFICLELKEFFVDVEFELDELEAFFD